MKLLALPALDDNYIWLLQSGLHALVVDPGDPAPVQAALAAHGLTLKAIFVTHHHGDHTDGVAALREASGCAVYGPAREAIPAPYTPVAGGRSIEALGLRFSVLDVPGHTAGHVAYVSTPVALQAAPPAAMQPQKPAPLLFCGDTLFAAGCGRIFEGTAAQMHASLQTLAALPPATRVCCAHEYTLANLRFAQAAEPDNPARERFASTARQQRAQGQPTLPTTIGTERAINPFLRSHEPQIVQQLVAASQLAADAADDPVACFAALRRYKDTFRPPP